ncbi:MAG: hypothetical protein KDJ39_07915 [Gammaproteobacteria bacterium]|nr:hypothetical protein [Gammaproteobacteria bacterium]MCP5298772.1 hypothetical protein [Chromatiaceae bacterium]
MKQTDLVDERGVRQVWYACPLCDAQHTVVQPSELRLHRIGSAQRCSSGWPMVTLQTI